jgi:hypothetical protein
MKREWLTCQQQKQTKAEAANISHHMNDKVKYNIQRIQLQLVI